MRIPLELYLKLVVVLHRKCPRLGFAMQGTSEYNAQWCSNDMLQDWICTSSETKSNNKSILWESECMSYNMNVDLEKGLEETTIAFTLKYRYSTYHSKWPYRTWHVQPRSLTNQGSKSQHLSNQCQKGLRSACFQVYTQLLWGIPYPYRKVVVCTGKV